MISPPSGVDCVFTARRIFHVEDATKKSEDLPGTKFGGNETLQKYGKFEGCSLLIVALFGLVIMMTPQIFHKLRFFLKNHLSAEGSLFYCLSVYWYKVGFWKKHQHNSCVFSGILS